MDQANYWQRLARRRITRRRLLAAGGATALGGAAALVVGCNGTDNGTGNGNGAGPGATGTPRPPAGSPVPGGTITWGRSVNVLGIDPHIDLTGLDIVSHLYSYMYSWNPLDEEVILNNLCAEFEQPDPEHLEFIFTLRPGVKVHPGGVAVGEEMTSEDCKRSFMRRGTSLTAPDKRFPHKIAGSGVPANLEAALLTPEPYVFRFTMAEPFVPAIREMANPTWAIVPAKVLEEHTSLSQMAIGSGPFMLEQFRGSERIALRRHPEYFHTGKPYLEGITYVVIPENSSLLQAFKAGQHDINGSVLTKDQFEELSADDRFITGRQPSLFYPVIHMKVRREPFDDVRVRKAINIALDRDEILQFIFDGEGNYNGPVQWPQVNWSLPQEELRQFYRYDPDQARSLLEEAGYGGGFSVRCKLPKLTGPNIIGDLAVVCRDQLRRVGIDMQLDEIELGAFITSVILPGNFEMAFFPNLPYDEPDRPLAFYHSKGVTGTGNWTNYANPEVDALIEEQAREFDRERRQEIIWEVQRKILEEHGPQLTLVGGYQYSARWNYVHFGWEQGQPPSEGTAPFAAEIWTSKV